MLSPLDKSLLRSDLFRHLDGIVCAPVIYSLTEKGVLDYLLTKTIFSISEISEKFEANEGYLNVALRMLGSQGWVNYQVDAETNQVTISINDKSEKAFQFSERYHEVVQYLKISEGFHPRNFDLEQFTSLNRIFTKYKQGDFN
ncbi:MAG TPA: polyketide synthase, partial [Flavobacteriaceae bacterium]|nr:polyketide synthase [Flavobacteriaceae bacterium]